MRKKTINSWINSWFLFVDLVEGRMRRRRNWAVNLPLWVGLDGWWLQRPITQCLSAEHVSQQRHVCWRRIRIYLRL